MEEEVKTEKSGQIYGLMAQILSETKNIGVVVNRRAFFRLISHIYVDDAGCWLWTSKVQKPNRISSGGYGWFKDGGFRSVLAHRYVYELCRGPIPEGLHIDHLCRVRRCVNPTHLEAVTRLENVQRGDAGLLERSRTHCKQGHPYSAENTGLYPNKKRRNLYRRCKTCARGYQRLWRAEQKGVAA